MVMFVMATFHQLEQFLELAEILHFGKTARKMGISQAALSRSIGKLERDLGFALFDREDRYAVRLTEAGESYASHCRLLLSGLDEAEEDARRLASGERGDLSLWMSASAAVCPEVQLLLTEVHHSRPAFRLRISAVSAGTDVQHVLKQREAHAVVLAGDSSWSPPEGIIRREIARYEEKVVLAIPGRHPVLQGQHFPGGLQSSHFILPAMASVPDVVKAFNEYFFRQFKREPVVAMEVTDPVCLLELAAAGVGIGVLAQREALPVHGVVFRELPLQIERRIWLLRRAEDHSPAVKLLFSCLKKIG